MNGHTAKRLRQETYGDNSQRVREYTTGKRHTPGTSGKGLITGTLIDTGARVNIGLRGQYLTAKGKDKQCLQLKSPTPTPIKRKRKPEGSGRWKRRARARNSA